MKRSWKRKSKKLGRKGTKRKSVKKSRKRRSKRRFRLKSRRKQVKKSKRRKSRKLSRRGRKFRAGSSDLASAMSLYRSSGAGEWQPHTTEGKLRKCQVELDENKLCCQHYKKKEEEKKMRHLASLVTNRMLSKRGLHGTAIPNRVGSYTAFGSRKRRKKNKKKSKRRKSRKRNRRSRRGKFRMVTAALRQAVRPTPAAVQTWRDGGSRGPPPLPPWVAALRETQHLDIFDDDPDADEKFEDEERDRNENLSMDIHNAYVNLDNKIAILVDYLAKKYKLIDQLNNVFLKRRAKAERETKNASALLRWVRMSMTPRKRLKELIKLLETKYKDDGKIDPELLIFADLGSKLITLWKYIHLMISGPFCIGRPQGSFTRRNTLNAYIARGEEIFEKIIGRLQVA